MNLVSAVVGLSIMGIAAPTVLEMSVTPIIAQKRASNFGKAESDAVIYSAENDGKTQLTTVPNGCIRDDRNHPAYKITCTEGENQFVQTVSRSFRLAASSTSTSTSTSTSCDNDGNNGHGDSGGYDCSNPGNGGYANNARVFSFATPTDYSGHSCPITDEWGVYGYNEVNSAALGGACTPLPLRDRQKYKDSDPDAWLYDANNFNGWGEHKDY